MQGGASQIHDLDGENSLDGLRKTGEETRVGKAKGEDAQRFACGRSGWAARQSI